MAELSTDHFSRIDLQIVQKTPNIESILTKLGLSAYDYTYHKTTLVIGDNDKLTK
ncbi:hypothetical protein GCM10025861_26140 [Methanobacterium petrolearium]|nr:hypothetical protein GCM10025861_26140 [Methanobacterium petrolearium]